MTGSVLIKIKLSSKSSLQIGIQIFASNIYAVSLKSSIILIEDIPLCFNSHNKTNSLFRQKHNSI